MKNIKKNVKKVVALVAEVIFPYQCLACGKMTKSKGLCGDCFNRVKFVTGAVCDKCGRPLSQNEKAWGICGFCMASDTHLVTRFAVVYDDASKPMILAFKHADRTAAVPFFAECMRRAGEDILAEADVLVPVPLYPLRLIKRRYNQAALLARAIAVKEGKDFASNLLKRVKHTAAQGHFSPHQREENVRGAFRASARAAARLAGKNVVLVDDVVTTGATAKACQKELLRAGAKTVKVLALAAVLKQ